MSEVDALLLVNQRLVDENAELYERIVDLQHLNGNLRVDLAMYQGSDIHKALERLKELEEENELLKDIRSTL